MLTSWLLWKSVPADSNIFPNRKNMVYRWLPHGSSLDVALSLGHEVATRPNRESHTINGTIDAADILRPYFARVNFRLSSSSEANVQPARL